MYKQITPGVHKLNVFAKVHVALQPKPKITRPKNFQKVETKVEVLKNVTQFSGCTAEIRRWVKINTVYQISFLAGIGHR